MYLYCLFEQIETLAAAMIHLGLEKGDHVALWGFNSIEWYLTFLAIAKANLISVSTKINK